MDTLIRYVDEAIGIVAMFLALVTAIILLTSKERTRRRPYISIFILILLVIGVMLRLPIW